MKRQMVRIGMALALVLVTIAAAMVWSGEYEKDPDPKAIFHIEAVRLEADRGFVWLEAHLKKAGEGKHDAFKPLQLITSDGTRHKPGDIDFAGTPEKGFTDIWVKFWLERKDLKGPIDLEINDGSLTVKSSQPVPDLADAGEDTVFKSSDWKKSWLGF